jgi:tetratricopeptide (TPR) repeat protein
MIDLKSSRMLSMAMKIPFVGLATAVLAVGASVGSVVAQTKQPLDWCGFKDMEGTLSDDTLADLIISGCTAVIESGKLTGKDLANIFNNRGNAYAAMKREFDRAIADYDQAIQRAPNLPGPYLNRAQTKSKKGDRAGFDADIARFKQLCDADRAACGFPPVPVSKDHR